MRLLEWFVALLPRCSFVRLSVSDGRALLSYGAQSMSTYSQPSFSSSTWNKGEVWICKLGEALNGNNDKYVVHCICEFNGRRRI